MYLPSPAEAYYHNKSRTVPSQRNLDGATENKNENLTSPRKHQNFRIKLELIGYVSLILMSFSFLEFPM